VSQYPYFPSPYLPPTFGSGDFIGGFDDGRRPAVAACIMQIILGCLLLLFSGLLAVVYRMRGAADIVEEMQRRGVSMPGQDLAQVVVLGVVVLGGGAVVLGIALVVLGIFVRRGSRGAAMTSIALLSLVALVCLMTLVGGLSQSGAIVLVLLYGSVLALCLATIANLLRALRAWRDRQSLAAMQQAWLMMQQPPASSYGYGYGYASAPDESSGPSPPASSSSA
jgi:MFS family permease